MPNTQDITGNAKIQRLVDRFDVLLLAAVKSTKFYRLRTKISASLRYSVSHFMTSMATSTDIKMKKQYNDACVHLQQLIDLLTAINAFKTTLETTDLMSMPQMRVVSSEILTDFEVMMHRVYDDLFFLAFKAIENPAAVTQYDTEILTLIICDTNDLYARPYDATLLGNYLESLDSIPAKSSFWREYFPLLKMVAATALFIVALLPPLFLGLPVISVGLMIAAFVLICVKVKPARANLFESLENLQLGLKQLHKKTSELNLSEPEPKSKPAVRYGLFTRVYVAATELSKTVTRLAT